MDFLLVKILQLMLKIQEHLQDLILGVIAKTKKK